MFSVLFIRKVRKVSGGQIKVRDYFDHCLHHPALDPFVYFTPDSAPDAGDLWADLPRDRVVDAVDPDRYDLLFLAGRDWRWLPAGAAVPRVINLIQHVKHADPSDPRFEYLRRPALRCCVSEEVRRAVEPHAVGEVSVVPAGIPLDLFHADAQRQVSGRTLVLATKDGEFGGRLASQLRDRGVDVHLLRKPVPRAELARMLREADITVGLPEEREGCYLPALEAMASGCAVVCADALGNRAFCEDGITALMPPHADLDAHIAAVETLLSGRALRERLRSAGLERARAFSLENERTRFYNALARLDPALHAGAASGVGGRP